MLSILLLIGLITWIIIDHSKVMKQLRQIRATGVRAEQVQPRSRKTAV